MPITSKDEINWGFGLSFEIKYRLKIETSMRRFLSIMGKLHILHIKFKRHSLYCDHKTKLKTMRNSTKSQKKSGFPDFFSTFQKQILHSQIITNNFSGDAISDKM